MSNRTYRNKWSALIAPERVDVLISVALILLLTVESAVAAGIPHRLVTALFVVPFAGPVAVRRRWPAAAVLCSTATLLMQDPFDGQLLNLPTGSPVLVLMLCSYGAAAWLPPRRTLKVLAAAAGMLAADQLIEQHVTHVSGGSWSGLAVLMLLFITPAVLGWFVRERHRRGTAFAELADQSVAERTARERAAVEQERLTIGQELQDIIAHSVSVMVVQASAARRVLREQPDRSRESILTVEQTGRETLAEMRRLLGLLRKDDDPRALTPQPGLDQLTELAVRLANAGLTCEMRTEGNPIELTPGINLVAYRVIETALERAAVLDCRHASATVRYESAQLQLEIRGDRQLPNLGEAIQSASERVELYGGRLYLLDDEHTQFAIRCVLPLEGAAA